MTVEHLRAFLGFLLHHGFFLMPLFGILVNPFGAHKCKCKLGEECSSPGKHPLSAWKEREQEPGELSSLMKGCVNERVHNLAVPTGQRSKHNNKYLVVLDIDNTETNQELIKSLPPTLSYKTGSGLHFWFWSRIAIPCSVSKLASKVDIRGTGGYVVVPPSRHVSGNLYEFQSKPSLDLADLPDNLYTRLGSLSSSPLKPSKTPKPLPVVSANPLGSLSTKEIRAKLDLGEKIPVGSRNYTIYKLLASDKAQGTCVSYAEIRDQAFKYRNLHVEDPASFLDPEVEGLSKSSILRIPIRNINKPEVMNSVYVKWLQKQGNHEVTVEKLDNLDREFFQTMIVPGDPANKEDWVSLSRIVEARKAWILERLGIEPSRYKLPTMGVKLTSLGFSRKHREKGNVWNIKLVQTPPPVCNTQDTTMSKVETTTIKIKNRVHPREHVYTGRKGWEHMRALSSFFSSMTREAEERLIDTESIGNLPNQEKVEEFIESVEVGDVIGVEATPFKVLAKTDSGSLECENLISGRTERVRATSAFSIALSCGFVEILYRNNKPFGLPEESEVELTVIDHTKEADKKEDDTDTPIL